MTAEEIAKKHYPEVDFDDCKMGCMRCDNDFCEAHNIAVKTLEENIKAYAADTLTELKRVKEEKAFVLGFNYSELEAKLIQAEKENERLTALLTSLGHAQD